MTETGIRVACENNLLLLGQMTTTLAFSSGWVMSESCLSRVRGASQACNTSLQQNLLKQAYTSYAPSHSQKEFLAKLQH